MTAYHNILDKCAPKCKCFNLLKFKEKFKSPYDSQISSIEKLKQPEVDENQRDFNEEPIDFNKIMEEKMDNFKAEIEFILEKDNERVFVQEKMDKIEADLEILKNEVSSSHEMIDLAELNDIKRSVSTGPDHDKIKSEVMDTLNMEITNLTNRIESAQSKNRESLHRVKVEINQILDDRLTGCGASLPSIDYDVLENLETGMKKHVTETLDNYVQMAEIEDLIANQLARGFSPSTAASLPNIYDRRPSVDRQSTTTADEQLQSEIQKINQRLGRFLERAEFHEEMKKVTSDSSSKMTTDGNQTANNALLIDLEAPSKSGFENICPSFLRI